MKVEISVPEVVSIFKEIQEQPENIFDMIRVEIRENVGEYLSRLMDAGLTHFHKSPVCYEQREALTASLHHSRFLVHHSSVSVVARVIGWRP